MRGKEGDFFSSCKPFQLCSGLRTETGSERRREAWEPTRLKERRKERKREKRNWDCVALCFILSTESAAGERRQQRKERKGRERVLGLSGGKEGEDAACKAKLGLELGGLSGSLPSGYSPTTHCSALHACLLAWLVQDLAPSPPFLSTPRCPLSLQPHPLQDPACFRSTVQPLPWSCG